MHLDGLERRVLLVMAAVCVLILAVSLVAYTVGLPLGGTDEAVESQAAEEAEANPTTPLELPAWGEAVLFFSISSVLGLAAGYLLPEVLNRRGERA